MSASPPFHLARLDTLRAAAVTVVVVFHLRPDLLPWGFIGVDLFFSLSGFLMSWLYLQAYAQGRPFGAGSFIARRFWRIFPALAMTVLGTLVGACFLMAPEHLLDTSWSAITSLFSVSNWGFYTQAGYFDTDSLVKPLLHTWSLGVEEQFYGVFALALLLARWVPLWLSLLTIAVLSFGLWGWVALSTQEIWVQAWWSVSHWHSEAFSALFYLPQYRGFQFAVGGLAAYWMQSRQTRDLGFRTSGIAGLAGMGMAIWLASQPSLAYLSAPVITLAAAAWMIHAPALDRLSGLGPIRYLARISYQLYLVHWPVVVFWHYVTLRPLSTPEALAAGALCIVLGDLLYRISNPLRAAS